MRSSSISVGATKVPARSRRRRRARAWNTAPAAARIASMCASMRRARLGVDHRADVDRERRRIADPALGHRALRASRSTASAPSSCTQSTRSAEQRWPALSNAEATTSFTTCSASADESTSIAFWPPVSAISGTGRPSSFKRAGEALLEQPRDLGRAGEHHAPDPRVADQRRADRLARPGQQLQHGARHAGAARAGAPSRRRSAASARPAWPAPDCRRRARRRPGR